MHNESPWFQRQLDRIEELIWAKQDDRMRASGWEVVRLGRWQRQYRHPWLLARALPAARLRAEREAQRLAAQRAAHRVPSQRGRHHRPVPARPVVPAGSATLLPGEASALYVPDLKGPAA